jgi:hypothetical protein
MKYEKIEDAIKDYVQIRDNLRLHQRAAKTEEDRLKSELEQISMWLREKGEELGVDSFKTPYGTAYKSIKESFRVEDWDSFVSWMVATKNFQCVEKRPAKNAVREIFRTDNEIPPGLNRFTEIEFNVLRPKEPAKE